MKIKSDNVQTYLPQFKIISLFYQTYIKLAVILRGVL